jgi:hypothetical protein
MLWLLDSFTSKYLFHKIRKNLTWCATYFANNNNLQILVHNIIYIYNNNNNNNNTICEKYKNI